MIRLSDIKEKYMVLEAMVHTALVQRISDTGLECVTLRNDKGHEFVLKYRKDDDKILVKRGDVHCVYFEEMTRLDDKIYYISLFDNGYIVKK